MLHFLAHKCRHLIQKVEINLLVYVWGLSMSAQAALFTLCQTLAKMVYLQIKQQCFLSNMTVTKKSKMTSSLLSSHTPSTQYLPVYVRVGVFLIKVRSVTVNSTVMQAPRGHIYNIMFPMIHLFEFTKLCKLNHGLPSRHCCCLSHYQLNFTAAFVCLQSCDVTEHRPSVAIIAFARSWAISEGKTVYIRESVCVRECASL